MKVYVYTMSTTKVESYTSGHVGMDWFGLLWTKKFLILDSERSDKCIDFTMVCVCVQHNLFK